MVIFMIGYFIIALLEIVYDYFVNEAMLNEILSGNHLMDKNMELIKIRRLRYKFVFILLRAVLWPITLTIGIISYCRFKKRGGKYIIDYYK